jgi:hypothetical protein
MTYGITMMRVCVDIPSLLNQLTDFNDSFNCMTLEATPDLDPFISYNR